MPRRLPKRDPIAAYKREVTAARRLGVGAQCECGEARPEALIEGSNPIVCARCQRKKDGMTTDDEHHPAGAANNSMTIPVPVNDHRAELSVAQADWPKQTLENPDDSPLVVIAGCIRGYIDTTAYLGKNLLPHAEMFEALNAFLTQKYGPKWWVGTELEHFQRRKQPK